LKKPEPVQEVLPEEQQMKEAQPLGSDELLPISGEKP
jgi:hypothetical protein